jgi:hypothetical protein
MIQPIINVMDPCPDSHFADMIQRSFLSLRRITLNRSDFPSSCAKSPDLSYLLFRRRQAASYMAMRDCDISGFFLAPIQNESSLHFAPQVIHADNAGNEITLCDLGNQNPCYSILTSFESAGEAARLKSQLKAWTTGMICCESEAIHDTPHALASIRDLSKGDDMTSNVPDEDVVFDDDNHDDDTSTVLFEDEELRKIMAETKGGSDLSKLLPCLSIDTMATFETDDGLRQEIKALDIIEDDLRKQMQDVDLCANGVYIQDVKMKSDSFDSLIQMDAGESRIPGTPMPDRSRKVHFSKKNTEYVFGGHAEDNENKTEGFGDMFLTTCEDLYYVLEEMSDEIGYACVYACQRTTKQFQSKPPLSGNRPVKRSTIHFCV